jgi:hypothetical protein
MLATAYESRVVQSPSLIDVADSLSSDDYTSGQQS